MIQIFYYLFSAVAIHRLEKGHIDHFSYLSNPNLILFQSIAPFRQEEYFISFQKEFPQVPQVYLILSKLDLEWRFPQGYSLDITSISTLGFTVKVVCESTSVYFQVEFDWVAFNDNKVLIINNFNVINPLSEYIHHYQNNCKKFNVAISNFVSYYATGPQYNNLTELILAPDTVTIRFYIQNLQQIGYQILLSDSDTFLLGPTITSVDLYGSSQVVSFPLGWSIQHCYANLLGFRHDGAVSNVRLFTQVSYSSQVIVGIYTWVSYILSFQYNYFCINDLQFEFAIFKSLIQTRLYDPLNSKVTHIEIQEINYSQNQIIQEELIIAQGTESIRIIYYWKCIDKEVLKMKMYCIEEWCSQTNIKCDVNKIHTIRLQAKFALNELTQQYIKIAKTSVSLSATQILKYTNPVEQVLFKIEIS